MNEGAITWKFHRFPFTLIAHATLLLNIKEKTQPIHTSTATTMMNKQLIKQHKFRLL